MSTIGKDTIILLAREEASVKKLSSDAVTRGRGERARAGKRPIVERQ